MTQITGLLDDSITGLTVRDAGPPAIDLSKINFEALAQRFKDSTHKNTDLEALKAAIRAKLGTLLRLNRTRADYAEQFEALIESYNAGSRSIEQLFDELLRFSTTLDDEQVRHLREQLSEEELVIFDILTRPSPELSTDERAEVKRVARELLTRLKELLVLNWRHKAAASAEYFRYARHRPDRIAIRDEWILRAIRDTLAEAIQPDGRLRRWVYIPEEQRYLRVVLLADGQAVHNAFFDRRFSP